MCTIVYKCERIGYLRFALALAVANQIIVEYEASPDEVIINSVYQAKKFIYGSSVVTTPPIS